MNHFAIFAKYWEPGKVKTRLAAAIGAAGASVVSKIFLQVLLDRFATIGDCRTLVFTPPEAEAEFRRIASNAWLLEPQTDGDLGHRLHHHFEHAFAKGAHNVIVIGSDSPTLPRSFVEQAWQALSDGAAVVLGPSDDGGYYLVGAHQRTPPNFQADTSWSTRAVWDQTVACLARHQIPFVSLPRWYDVDEWEDLQRLFSELMDQTDSSLGCDDDRKAFTRILEELLDL